MTSGFCDGGQGTERSSFSERGHDAVRSGCGEVRML